MRQRIAIGISLVVVAVVGLLGADVMGTEVIGADVIGRHWVFRASPYSHDPETGDRVSRYAEPVASLGTPENVIRAVYTHHRVRFRTSPGGGNDTTHITESTPIRQEVSGVGGSCSGGTPYWYLPSDYSNRWWR